MSERPTSGMLPADYPMAECRICGHWSYLAGVLDDPVCLGCRRWTCACGTVNGGRRCTYCGCQPPAQSGSSTHPE